MRRSPEEIYFVCFAEFSEWAVNTSNVVRLGSPVDGRSAAAFAGPAYL